MVLQTRRAFASSTAHLHCSERQRWLHIGSTELYKQPKLKQSFAAIGDSPLPAPAPGLPPRGPSENRQRPCHLTTPQRPSAQIAIIPAALPSSHVMKKDRGGRRDMQKSLSLVLVYLVLGLEAVRELYFCRTSRGFDKTFRESLVVFGGLNVKRTDHI